MTIDELLTKAKEIRNSTRINDENVRWYEVAETYQKALNEFNPIIDEVAKLIDPRIVEILDMYEDLDIELRQLM